MASRGDRMRTDSPSTSTSPVSKGSTPKIARASSVLPEPCSPARPTTSPDLTSRSMSPSMPPEAPQTPRRAPTAPTATPPPGPALEADAPRHAPGSPPNPQTRLPDILRLRPRRIVVIQVAPDHHPHQFPGPALRRSDPPAPAPAPI